MTRDQAARDILAVASARDALRARIEMQKAQLRMLFWAVQLMVGHSKALADEAQPLQTERATVRALILRLEREIRDRD